MKKYLSLLLLLLPTLTFGQIPSATAAGNITASGGTCATAGACVSLITTRDAATINVSVTGTFSATLQVEQSSDNVNFFPMPGSAITGITLANYPAYPFFRIRASAYTSGTAVIQLSSNFTAANTANGDPCLNPAFRKASAVINISTAATTQLVSAVANQSVYVCGFTVSMVATVAANTLVFEYGTAASCGTGTTALTGVMSSGILANGATTLSYGDNGTIFSAPNSNGICALTTVGTGPSIAGILTYVQY